MLVEPNLDWYFLEICSFLKEDLRPKSQLCFYGIILFLLRRKCLAQNFVVFLSVLTKLWSYKVFNPAWVTPYSRMHKKFHPWFSWYIFVSFLESTFWTGLCSFWPIQMNLWCWEILNDKIVFRSKWLHRRKLTDLLC